MEVKAVLIFGCASEKIICFHIPGMYTKSLPPRTTFSRLFCLQQKCLN